ncbi:MAG: type II/IV secretion system protein, partial [Planctomycetota bacterium]
GTARVCRGRGCPGCTGTGYFERQGLFELLVLDDQLRALVHDRAPVGTLRAAALAAGMRTLRQEGVRRILAGKTTPAEVLRVTQTDGNGNEKA